MKLILTNILLIVILGAAADKPDIATIMVESNYDLGLVRKEFRVHYSGSGLPKEDSRDVTIKIYKDSEEKHSYNIPETVKTNPKAYYFALSDAASGQYYTKVCAGGECSSVSPALSLIPEESSNIIVCKRYEVDGTATDPAQVSIESPKGLLEEKDLNNLPEESEYKTQSFDKNPDYKHGRLYVAVKYNMSLYREFFDTQQYHIQQGDMDYTYANEKCSRLYIAAGNVHLVKTDTKEVMYRLQNSLALTQRIKDVYIFPTDAPMIPIELADDFPAGIANGQYELWVSICFTNKDKVESTVCSDPLIQRVEVKEDILTIVHA